MIRNADDLRALIREYGADDPDPGRVTEKILATLTGAEAHVVADVALRDYVRRMLAAGGASVPGARSYETASGQRTPSWKIAGLIDHIESELNRSVYVETSAEWKRLGECTPDDVDALAAARRRKAAEVIAEAERFERLAEVAREADAEIVRDLPRDVLAEVLGR